MLHVPPVKDRLVSPAKFLKQTHQLVCRARKCCGKAMSNFIYIYILYFSNKLWKSFLTYFIWLFWLFLNVLFTFWISEYILWSATTGQSWYWWFSRRRIRNISAGRSWIFSIRRSRPISAIPSPLWWFRSVYSFDSWWWGCSRPSESLVSQRR